MHLAGQFVRYRCARITVASAAARCHRPVPPTQQTIRAFISLPTLPSLPFGGPFNSRSSGKDNDERQTYKERRRLNYSLNHVQQVVSDVNQYSSFVPWCVESNVLKRYDDQNFDAELAVGFKMFVERYTSRVSIVPGKSVTATSKDTGVFRVLKTHWSFEKVHNTTNAVDIDFNVEFEFKSQIYSTASAHFLDEVVGEMVGAFEKQCAVVTPRKSTSGPNDTSPTIAVENTLFSTQEFNAVSERFNAITSSQGGGVMNLSQFKKMYYDLFVHSSSETIEEEKMSTTTKQNTNPNNIALVIKMGELMTRTVTEKDLHILAERHFHVMDLDQSGTLDVNEFIAGMQILLNGSIEQQWQHSFKMFDLNNDGYITKDCLMKMFHATSNVQMKMLHELLKFSRDQLIVDGHHDIAKQFQIDIDQLSEQKTRTDEEEKKMHEEYSIAVQELAQEIFDEVDLDGDSKISYQEFCKSKILLAEVERLSAHKVSFFAT